MSEIVIYQTEDGQSRLSVKLEDETIWLTQSQLVDLYKSSKSNVSEHIKHIFEERELEERSVVRKFRTTANDGKNYEVAHYNLDMVISLGYRIKSKVATQFRIWATERIKEYIIKGFTMDDERLKGNAGGSYWKELIARIKDIRSSEKVMYRQVLDLFATSIDYDAKSSLSIEFFKIVQNKLHYATHGHTAPELIFDRVDSDKEFMGVASFQGALPTKKEAQIAKNYLTEKELKILNGIVSAYFDLAEVYAERHEHLYMQDYITHLDNILRATGEKVLDNAGKISKEQAMQKVDAEYKKYQVKTLTPVEKAYLEMIKNTEKKLTMSKKDTKE